MIHPHILNYIKDILNYTKRIPIWYDVFTHSYDTRLSLPHRLMKSPSDEKVSFLKLHVSFRKRASDCRALLRRMIHMMKKYHSWCGGMSHLTWHILVWYNPFTHSQLLKTQSHLIWSIHTFIWYQAEFTPPSDEIATIRIPFSAFRLVKRSVSCVCAWGGGP